MQARVEQMQQSKIQVAEVSCVWSFHDADIIECATSLSPVTEPEPTVSVAQ